MAAANIDPVAAAVAERKPYYEKRIKLFEQYAERQKAVVESAKEANVQITVILPDGKSKNAVKSVTTPLDIAKEISAGLAKKVVVADVDGRPWDLTRPLEDDCALKLFTFDDPEGKDVSVWLGWIQPCVQHVACRHTVLYGIHAICCKTAAHL